MEENRAHKNVLFQFEVVLLLLVFPFSFDFTKYGVIKMEKYGKLGSGE